MSLRIEYVLWSIIRSYFNISTPREQTL